MRIEQQMRNLADGRKQSWQEACKYIQPPCWIEVRESGDYVDRWSIPAAVNSAVVESGEIA